MSYNHTINLLKRLYKETLVFVEASERNNPSPLLPDEQMTYRILEQSIAQIVSKLPPQQKAVYQLSREQYMKQEDIGRQLQISISTVQNHMTQALRTIREKLTER